MLSQNGMGPPTSIIKLVIGLPRGQAGAGIFLSEVPLPTNGLSFCQVVIKLASVPGIPISLYIQNFCSVRDL